VLDRQVRRRHVDCDELRRCPDALTAFLLVEGRAATAGLERYAKDVKQRIGYHDPRKGSRLVWQPGLYDRVLREDESTIIVAKYILENPVRKGLVKEPREYPYSGSSEWTWEQMLEMWQTSANAVGMG
jgi:hypothetical protein